MGVGKCDILLAESGWVWISVGGHMVYNSSSEK